MKFFRGCLVTNLQAPEIPNVVLLDFLNSRGGVDNVTGLELESTLICEMK